MTCYRHETLWKKDARIALDAITRSAFSSNDYKKGSFVQDESATTNIKPTVQSKCNCRTETRNPTCAEPQNTTPKQTLNGPALLHTRLEPCDMERWTTRKMRAKVSSRALKNNVSKTAVGNHLNKKKRKVIEWSSVGFRTHWCGKHAVYMLPWIRFRTKFLSTGVSVRVVPRLSVSPCRLLGTSGTFNHGFCASPFRGKRQGWRVLAAKI